MAEPISHAAIAGGLAYAAGQSFALQHGQFLGAAPEAFVLGLIGAFAVCAWQDAFDKPRKTYAGIFLTMLIAGYGSPAVADAISHYFVFLTKENLFFILPLLIGVIVPILGPVGFTWAKKKWGSDNA